MSIDIARDGFNSSSWFRMVVEAGETQLDQGSALPRDPKYIYKVTYPGLVLPRGLCYLHLYTKADMEAKVRDLGTSRISYVKMPLREVLNVTRICSSGAPIRSELLDQIERSYTIFSQRAEKKYKNGFIGSVRKLTSIFFNLFTSDVVNLFSSRPNGVVKITNPQAEGKLPKVIGSDVDFIEFLKSGQPARV